MNILTLDLGTKTGWALHRDGAVSAGTVVLATEKELKAQKLAKLDRCCDMRASRLRNFILNLYRQPIDQIWFEDVQFASTQLQAQLWGGLRATVTCFYPEIKIVAIPVGTLKKFASGNGAAKKPEMADALVKLLPEKYGFMFTPKHRRYCVELPSCREVDDNEVDAIHLLHLARKTLCP